MLYRLKCVVLFWSNSISGDRVSIVSGKEIEKNKKYKLVIRELPKLFVLDTLLYDGNTCKFWTKPNEVGNIQRAQSGTFTELGFSIELFFSISSSHNDNTLY